MPDLTNDELTLLMLADNGEFLAPIGRWKPSILALTEKGFLRKVNDVNYVITPAGSAARSAGEQAADQALVDVLESRKAPAEAGEAPTEFGIAEELKNG